MEEASDVHLRDKEAKIFILQGLLLISSGLYLENVNFSAFWLVPGRGWVPRAQPWGGESQTLGVRSYRHGMPRMTGDGRKERAGTAQLHLAWGAPSQLTRPDLFLFHYILIEHVPWYTVQLRGHTTKAKADLFLARMVSTFKHKKHKI